MYFKQFFDKKLAQTSYMIGCQKTQQAIIIDPKRVLKDYEDTATAEGFNITHVTETHIHADFASGLRNAITRFNASAFVSDEGDEEWKYKNMPPGTIYLKDGDTIHVGNVELKVVHTPGHTPESISFVLTDHGGGSDEPMGIFTGDFMFVGDIGRPDLLEEAAKMIGTAEVGANQMYDSLNKMKDYPDYMMIWPGHGAGSACGKSLGAVPFSTLGYERLNNWAFKYDNKEDFIKALMSDQPEPPTYFAQMKKVNKIGLPEFAVKDIKIGLPDDLPGQIFDLRSKEQFSKGFKKGAFNIPYNEKFLQFAGWYIDYNKPMTVIADPEISHALQEDLASIGFDNLELIVPADRAHKYFNDSYENVAPDNFVKSFDDRNILDVRSISEYQSGNLDNAHHIHFGQLDGKSLPFSTDDTIYVHCQSGVRSAIAVSVLKAQGFNNVVNIEHGYAGIKQAM